MWVQIAYQKQEVKALFNTLPYNSFPASTAKFEEGKNDAIQAEIDAIKDGTNIDSFGDVETALSLKVNSADMETALATKTNLSNIAPTFDSESGTYDIGEQVIYEGVLYEFISAHDTPGDWDSTEVQAVKISELIDTLNSNLNTLESGLNNATNRLSANNIIGQVVDLTQYTDANPFLIPSDGYVWVYSQTQKSTVIVVDHTYTNNLAVGSLEFDNAMYVKAGMYVYFVAAPGATNYVAEYKPLS